MVEETAVLQVMPHAPGMEAIAVSSVLRWPHLQDELQLDEGHFYLQTNRIVFTWSQRLRPAEGEIDLTVLVQRMHDAGELEAAGGAAKVADAWTRATVPYQVFNVIDDLREKKARRMAIAAATAATEAAFDISNGSEFLQALGEPMTAVFDAAAANKPVMDTKAAVTAWLDEYQALCSGQESPKGMQTSLQVVNDYFGGLHTKQIVIVAGKPTAGKSVLAGQFCADVAENGHPSLYVSLEMPKAKLISRLITYLSGLPGMATVDPLGFAAANNRQKPTREELQKIRDAVHKLAEIPIFIEDPAGATIGQIVALIRRYHRKHGIKLVAIDYVQLIRGTRSKGGNKEEEVADISHSLQAVAKELDLCIIVLSQLNQNMRTKYAEAIFEDADLMLSIILDEETNDHLGLGIKKDRHHGHTGTKIDEVKLDKVHVRFRQDPRIHH